MKKLITLTTLSVALLAAGCTSTPKTTPDTLGADYELEKSAANPSPKGAQANKVVLFDVEDGGLAAVKEAKLDNTIKSQLDRSIRNGGGQVVDRDLASGLKEEIKRSIMAGEGSYQGAPVADYAIITKVSNATYGSSFDEAWVDDDGDRHPAECDYSASVSATVNVYTLPELKRVKSLDGEDSASTSEETRSSDCGGINYGGLLRSAAEGSMVDIKGQLKSFFAPVGYVTGAKVYLSDEGQVVLKTSLTSDLGAKPGGGVDIARVQTNGDRYKVAEGEIGKPVLQSGANVVVEKASADKIKIGDEVSLDYSCSFMGCKFDEAIGQ